MVLARSRRNGINRSNLPDRRVALVRRDHEARNRYFAAFAVGLGVLVCAALAAAAIASSS